MSESLEGFRKSLINFKIESDDFSVFKARPLIQLGSPDLVIPIDISMLIDKFETGPFWAVRATFEPKDQTIFNFWGACFERYVLDLLFNSLDSSTQLLIDGVRFTDGEPLCDALLFEGDCLILVEIKASFVTSASKYYRNPAELEEEVKKKFIDKDGLYQLEKGVDGITSGRGLDAEVMERIRSVKTIYPILITLDRIGSCVGFTHFVNGFAKSNRPRTIGSFEVMPITTVGIDDLELVSGHLKSARLSEMLSDWIKQDPELRARLRSFFPEGISGGNPWLRKQYKEIAALLIKETGLAPPEESVPGAPS